MAMRALQNHSPDTWQHALRVGRYAAALALALDLPEHRVSHLERCGLLHDVGKLVISRHVLEKPGRLSEQEWVLIREHPGTGARLLRPHRCLDAVLPAVAMHHERIDGTGYPYRLTGEEIPLDARIVSVCDAYDTMTSDRPYCRAYSPEEASFRLRQGAGTQFDARLTEAFVGLVVPAFST